MRSKELSVLRLVKRKQQSAFALLAAVIQVESWISRLCLSFSTTQTLQLSSGAEETSFGTVTQVCQNGKAKLVSISVLSAGDSNVDFAAYRVEDGSSLITFLKDFKGRCHWFNYPNAPP